MKRECIPAVSVLVGSGSIYRIIPCDESMAMKAIRSGARRPLSVVRLPETMAIAAPAAMVVVDTWERMDEGDEDRF